MNEKRKAICILGSGRCGTSAMTRAINLLGVHIGSNFLATDETNPKGFFEDATIVKFNQAMIYEFAGHEHHFPPDWIKSEKAKQYKKEIIEYLKKSLANSEIWAWKDPRTCYTLDLWKEILRELNVLPHYVIMVRNPIDVVHSLFHAYNTNKTDALYTWKLRTLLAFSKTYGEHRIVIDYDHLIGDSAGTLRKISDEFKLTWPQDEKQFINNLNSFIDPNLQHSRSGMKKLIAAVDYNEEIKELYGLFYKSCLSKTFLNSAEFNSKVAAYLRALHGGSK